MTENGADVSFPIGFPKYLAPEIVATHPIHFGHSFDRIVYGSSSRVGYFYTCLFFDFTFYLLYFF